MSETNTIEFYEALAKALEEKSKTERWSDKVSVEVLGKTYEVGPFRTTMFREDIRIRNDDLEDFITEDHESLHFSFEGDEFAVVSHEGGFDSWGEYEVPYLQGIRFGVARLAKQIKVFERIYV